MRVGKNRWRGLPFRTKRAKGPYSEHGAHEPTQRNFRCGELALGTAEWGEGEERFPR